ncbi:hypothetical protein ACQ4LE_008726 [Meloidogyne hapla]|uniref:Uncharacterized protein n=1 Tax=Meloidogyne hapla TaxID=6305 RepID=A0A1I8BYY4_MELHA
MSKSLRVFLFIFVLVFIVKKVYCEEDDSDKGYVPLDYESDTETESVQNSGNNEGGDGDDEVCQVNRVGELPDEMTDSDDETTDGEDEMTDSDDEMTEVSEDEEESEDGYDDGYDSCS